MRKSFVGFMTTLLVLAGAALLTAQGDLSVQVLRLLTRTNTWSPVATQTFYGNIKIAAAVPVDTTTHLYNSGGTLMWDGAPISAGGAGAAHNLLSATHLDTVAAAAVRGALIVGNATPAWNLLAVGATPGMMLRSDGTDVSWSTNGSALTSLNATNLASGTVPLAQISGLTDTQVAAGAAIAWTKLSKTGSSLADLTTRSAADLTSGVLSNSRLSASVTLLGSSIDLTTAVTGTLPRANGGTGLAAAADDNVMVGSGAAWVSTAVPNCVNSALGYATAGNTFSCLALSTTLTVPSILSVAGSPVVGTGTLAVTLANEAANLVFAGPTTGAATTPTFRGLVTADFPVTGVGAGTYTKVTVDTSGRVTTGATGVLSTDFTGVLPLANGGTGASTAADDTTLVSSGAAWVVTALPNCPGGGLGYTTATNLYSCPTLTHTLLSATHTDTLADTVVRGDLLIGNATPKWARLPKGTTGQLVGTDGNDVTWLTPTDKLWLDAGKCQNTTVVLDWSTPTTNPGVGTCVTGTNTQKLVVAFDNSANRSIQRQVYLPATWLGALDVSLVWSSPVTTGNVIWNVATACVATGSTGDPAFNAPSTVTTAAPAGAGTYVTSSIAGVTATGCTAGSVLYLKVSRYYTGSDTLNGTVNLAGMQLTERRTLP